MKLKKTLLASTLALATMVTVPTVAQGQIPWQAKLGYMAMYHMMDMAGAIPSGPTWVRHAAVVVSPNTGPAIMRATAEGAVIGAVAGAQIAWQSGVPSNALTAFLTVAGAY